MSERGWKARPTIYRGIRMRSRLEARAASMLDELECPWEYEPVCFRHGKEEYLPDFQIADKTFVEVKPWIEPGTGQGDFMLKQLADLDRAVRVLRGAVTDCFLWVLFSDGAFLQLLPNERQIGGYLGRCLWGHLSLGQADDIEYCLRCGDPTSRIVLGAA